MIYVGVIGPIGSEQRSLVNCVMVMNFGEKLAEGSPEEVMARPEVKKVTLGSEEERC